MTSRSASGLGALAVERRRLRIGEHDRDRLAALAEGRSRRQRRRRTSRTGGTASGFSSPHAGQSCSPAAAVSARACPACGRAVDRDQPVRQHRASCPFRRDRLDRLGVDHVADQVVGRLRRAGPRAAGRSAPSPRRSASCRRSGRAGRCSLRRRRPRRSRSRSGRRAERPSVCSSRSFRAASTRWVSRPPRRPAGRRRRGGPAARRRPRSRRR